MPKKKKSITPPVGPFYQTEEITIWCDDSRALTKKWGREFDVILTDPPMSVRTVQDYVIIWEQFSHLLKPKGLLIVLMNPQDGIMIGDSINNIDILPWDGLTPENVPDVHPNRRPVLAIEEILKTTKGNILDPFMGAGSTLLAAKHLGRKAVGIELEKKYCDAAVKALGETPEIHVPIVTLGGLLGNF